MQSKFQMLIKLKPQHLAIFKLELELFAIEPWIVLVDNPMVIGTDDNDVRGVVVLRTGEVVNVMGLDNAVTILVANFLAADLVAIVVEPLQGQDDAAVNATILHQPLLLLNRSGLVGHEELACSCPAPASAQTGTHSSPGTRPAV